MPDVEGRLQRGVAHDERDRDGQRNRRCGNRDREQRHDAGAGEHQRCDQGDAHALAQQFDRGGPAEAQPALERHREQALQKCTHQARARKHRSDHHRGAVAGHGREGHNQGDAREA